MELLLTCQDDQLKPCASTTTDNSEQHVQYYLFTQFRLSKPACVASRAWAGTHNHLVPSIDLLMLCSNKVLGLNTINVVFTAM
jgi:hypothetical protein